MFSFIINAVHLILPSNGMIHEEFILSQGILYGIIVVQEIREFCISIWK